MVRVFIDARHGGKDPGAIGNGMREKDITLLVAKKLGAILERHNVNVSYSRIMDKYVSLNERARMANNIKADIFVSIHTNSYKYQSVQGLETFSYPGSSKGRKLAKYIQDSIIETKLYTKDRGIKTANFAVLRQSKMPATLVELGFITNKQDSQLLRTRQNNFSEAIAKGILKYLEVKYIPVKEKLEGNKYFRVVAGSYKDRSLAEEQQLRLKEKGFDSFIDIYEDKQSLIL